VKDILEIVLVVIMFLLAIITSILADHKEEIWECIEFDENYKK